MRTVFIQPISYGASSRLDEKNIEPSESFSMKYCSILSLFMTIFKKKKSDTTKGDFRMKALQDICFSVYVGSPIPKEDMFF